MAAKVQTDGAVHVIGGGGDASGDPYAVGTPDFFRDPYRIYRELRQADPVHWNERLGAWLVTRYRDVSAGLRDPRLSSRRLHQYVGRLPKEVQQELETLRRFYESWLLYSDAPYHTRLKAVASAALPPATALEHEIRRTADALLDDVQYLSPIDIVSMFARPLSVFAVAKLIGVDASECHRIATWSRDIVAFIGTGCPVADLGRQAQGSLSDFLAYLRDHLATLRALDAGDSLTSRLFLAQRKDNTISDEMIVMLVANLLVDGHEPIANVISNGILALLQNPGELMRLRGNPCLFPMAVEELLRYDCPFQYAARRTTEPMQLGDRLLGGDQRVLLMLAAANRDPDAFADPDRLDLTRSFQHHRAFGFGAHFCLGATVSRLTIRIAVEALLRRFQHLVLVPQRLEWHESLGFRGLRSLLVTA